MVNQSDQPSGTKDSSTKLEGIKNDDNDGNSTVPEVTSQEDLKLTKIRQKLNNYQDIIANTAAYKQSMQRLPATTSIRCLALGSPSESNIAMYQLAYLVLLSHHFECKISVYDPVFNEVDRTLLGGLNMTVEEDYDAEDDIVYYLPHAPLDLTESLIKDTHPKYLLANNLMKHTERLTRSKLHQQYPSLSHLVNLVSSESSQDDFITVRRKKYIPPVIVYDYAQYYFTQMKVMEFDNDGPLNCFSDMSLHIIE